MGAGYGAQVRASTALGQGVICVNIADSCVKLGGYDCYRFVIIP